jgi:hypothetical protein
MLKNCAGESDGQVLLGQMLSSLKGGVAAVSQDIAATPPPRRGFSTKLGAYNMILGAKIDGVRYCGN